MDIGPIQWDMWKDLSPSCVGETERGYICSRCGPLFEMTKTFLF